MPYVPQLRRFVSLEPSTSIVSSDPSQSFSAARVQVVDSFSVAAWMAWVKRMVSTGPSSTSQSHGIAPLVLSLSASEYLRTNPHTPPSLSMRRGFASQVHSYLCTGSQWEAALLAALLQLVVDGVPIDSIDNRNSVWQFCGGRFCHGLDASWAISASTQLVERMTESVPTQRLALARSGMVQPVRSYNAATVSSPTAGMVLAVRQLKALQVFATFSRCSPRWMAQLAGTQRSTLLQAPLPSRHDPEDTSHVAEFWRARTQSRRDA